MKKKKKKYLIVKTSSFGDVIQAFPALEYLKKKEPEAEVDWAVGPSSFSLVESHPLVNRAIFFSIRTFFKGQLKSLRKTKYDAVFDLQGNSKSAFVTFFSRGKDKVGFGAKSVREWPNLLATRLRFNSDPKKNIREQYTHLIQNYFQEKKTFSPLQVNLSVSEGEKEKLDPFFLKEKKLLILVCPGTRWKNKQIAFSALEEFLSLIQDSLSPHFLFVWGNLEEKKWAETLCDKLGGKVVDKLPLSTLQTMISRVDLVVAVDSFLLHLAGTTTTPSFSVFGPTKASIFKPLGEHHYAFQGKCPYKREFIKQCPILRTCKTGACIQNREGKELFSSFIEWWERLNLSYSK